MGTRPTLRPATATRPTVRRPRRRPPRSRPRRPRSRSSLPSLLRRRWPSPRSRSTPRFHFFWQFVCDDTIRGLRGIRHVGPPRTAEFSVNLTRSVFLSLSLCTPCDDLHYSRPPLGASWLEELLHQSEGVLSEVRLELFFHLRPS